LILVTSIKGGGDLWRLVLGSPKNIPTIPMPYCIGGRTKNVLARKSTMEGCAYAVKAFRTKLFSIIHIQYE